MTGLTSFTRPTARSSPVVDGVGAIAFTRARAKLRTTIALWTLTTEPARVRAMFVRSGWTRQGIGRAILEASEAAARAEGFSRMVLGATLPGVPLYAAYGFFETGRFTLKTPDGVELEGASMEKEI